MASINIKNYSRDDDGLPYCPPSVYEEIKKNFNLNTILLTQHRNNDETVGYIRGVMDVLGRLKVLAKYNEDEE